jgi:hypothetical protein
MELLLLYASSSSSSSVDNGSSSILKGLVRKNHRSDGVGDDYWSDVKTDDRGPSSLKETRSRTGKTASTSRGSLSHNDADGDDSAAVVVSRGSPSLSVSKRMLRVARESLFGQWY